MGAQFSKTAGKEETAAETPGEAAASLSPSKANGQENGHVEVNGDASPAAAEEKEEVTTAPAEKGEKAAAAPAEKEAVEGGKTNTEVSASTEEEATKAEDGAHPSTSNETPKKKKKRFSFKKSFKLSGFSFKKTKNETGDDDGREEAKTEADEAVEGGASEEKAKPVEEAESKPEEKPVEEPKAASLAPEESKEEEKPAEPAAITEPAPSKNEAPVTEESTPTVQEAESSPEVLAESATD
ncbi:myristoylated alanine-rich C-kinase substrate-like [Carassius carassius]|uniref:myristoylated alanine-rich C-kinase substrate-like n=1 Tax=Carassius carassius TaxID=217509 RepID=UPI0028693533|nr:myristoylated alanine-rich C-kinase substrate-like [Carassius carassius]